jgi:predicted dehydrogenase
MRAMADRGEFGEIYFAKASTLRRLGNPGGWFSDIERSGGGPLIDIGVHVIDLCWYMMGRPKPVSVSANTYRTSSATAANVKNLSFYQAADYDAEKNTVEDMANALIRFENGASLLVDVSFTLHAKSNETAVKLYGEKGGFEIDPETVIVTEQNDTILNTYIRRRTTKALILLALSKMRSITLSIVSASGTQPISPVADGVEIMKILVGIYESAAKGAEVRL